MRDYNIFKIKINYIPFGIGILVLTIFFSTLVWSKMALRLAFYDTPVVLDIEHDVDDDQIKSILSILRNDASINPQTVELIPAEKNQEYLARTVDGVILAELDTLGVFRDLILFNFENEASRINLREELIDEIKNLEGVKSVHTSAEEVLNETQVLSRFRIVLIPIICFFGFLVFLMLRAMIKNNLMSNRTLIRSFKKRGLDDSKIKRLYIAELNRVYFRVWLISIPLFLVLLYLILMKYNITFYDLGIISIIVTIVVPLIIVILMSIVFVYRLYRLNL